MQWNRAPLPAFCWGRADEIDQRLRVTYRPDVDTTLLVQDKLKAMGPVPFDVSTLALRRLGCISAEVARRALSPEMRSGGWRLTEAFPSAEGSPGVMCPDCPAVTARDGSPLPQRSGKRSINGRSPSCTSDRAGIWSVSDISSSA